MLRAGAISVARSYVPGNRCAVDKTIEETFMKLAKSHGGSGGCGAGLTGILTNFNAYQRWVKTTHERAQYVDVTYANLEAILNIHVNNSYIVSRIVPLDSSS